ncbi:MAG TPA: 2TM domain-containing protein [Arsenicitalea sp.]|jgi:hypothetical protein|nr:2TM domain-containing protein [Arsenicitalea sp.]
MSTDSKGRTSDETRAEVHRQVRAIRNFYVHAVVYAAAMVLLVVINFASGDALHGNWWVQWVAMPWGVLLLLHGIFALRNNAMFGPEWEERKVEELLKEREQRGSR